MGFAALVGGGAVGFRLLTRDDGTPIGTAELEGSGRALSFITSCNSHLEGLDVNETGTEVHLRLDMTETSGGGDECGQELRVDLAAPLGDRRVIDDHDGSEIVVHGARQSVALDRVLVSAGDRRVLVETHTCGRALRASVEVGRDEVTLRATMLDRQQDEGACAERATVDLPAPLAGRRLIDARTGEEIPPLDV